MNVGKLRILIILVRSYKSHSTLKKKNPSSGPNKVFWEKSVLSVLELLLDVIINAYLETYHEPIPSTQGTGIGISNRYFVISNLTLKFSMVCRLSALKLIVTSPGIRIGEGDTFSSLNTRDPLPIPKHKKCNLTLAMGPLCHSISPLPSLLSYLLYKCIC